MIVRYPPLPEEALAEADALVASSEALWDQFVEELDKLGTVTRREDGTVEFRQRYESEVRVFAISAEQLRDGLVRDLAYYGLQGERVSPVRRLPTWFVDGLVEFVGSREEPYDHRFVVLVGCELSPSTDGVHPPPGSVSVLPNPVRPSE